MLQIMQRPAAERREAGAEDEARVDQIGFGDDAFLQHALCLRQIGSDELLHELRPIRIGLALHRSAVLPAVDALAGFLAEAAGFDVAGEHLGNGGRIFGERVTSLAFELTKRDVVYLMFFVLAVLGLTQWILHLLFVYSVATLLLRQSGAARGSTIA